MPVQNLPDIQKTVDQRDVAINHVGVSNLRHPISVKTQADGPQQTIATLTMAVGLPAEVKGTHMSRFIEALSEYDQSLSSETLPLLVHEIQERLHAQEAKIEVEFPYFLERSAPVTGRTALMDYTCRLVAESQGDETEVTVGITVPVASLCPCSKEISEYGAHNQRGDVEITLRTVRDDHDGAPMVWFEELVAYAEESASAPLYPLLKRPDERYVTMQAYDNPAFVEDIVRNVAVRLRDDERIAWFKVRVTNYESIHNHNAFAEVCWSRR